MRSPTPALMAASAAAALALAFGGALAWASGPRSAQESPAESNELGFTYTVVSSGAVTTLDLHLAPKKNFDTLVVEAASGVATLSPPCAFKALVAGGSYSCRIDVTGAAPHPAMTINILGRRSTAGVPIPETEIQHVSLNNPGYSPAARPKPKTSHQLPRSASKSAQ